MKLPQGGKEIIHILIVRKHAGKKRKTAKQVLRKLVENPALKYFVFHVALPTTDLDILGIFEK